MIHTTLSVEPVSLPDNGWQLRHNRSCGVVAFFRRERDAKACRKAISAMSIDWASGRPFNALSEDTWAAFNAAIEKHKGSW